MTDYGVPMINEQPDDFKSILVDVKDEFGPMGAKSISEIACNGAAPAIGNAIHDACGVWVRSWPMTPEKILREHEKVLHEVSKLLIEKERITREEFEKTFENAMNPAITW